MITASKYYPYTLMRVWEHKGVRKMSDGGNRAVNYWEVDRQTAGEFRRPYCVIILRNKKKTGKSKVQAASADFESMCRYADQMSKDLYDLTDEEFITKYNLETT